MWTRTPVEAMADLTPFQQVVARSVADGLRNKEIARAQRCSESVVKNAVTVIFKRTGTGTRVELARWVWQGAGS